MKLTCDVCGGELQMTSGGQTAVCVNCGITYSIERLREKLDIQPADSTNVDDHNKKTHQCSNDSTSTRYLRIRRKVDLFVCKAAVIIDGQQCATLENLGKETVIPISQGTHRIFIRVASAAGITDMDELTFHVKDHDWYGEFWLHRGAFKASYKFDLQELL